MLECYNITLVLIFILLAYLIISKTNILNRVSTKFNIPSKFQTPSLTGNSLVYTDGEGNLLSSGSSITLDSLSGNSIEMYDTKKSYIVNNKQTGTVGLGGTNNAGLLLVGSGDKEGQRSISLLDNVQISGKLAVSGNELSLGSNYYFMSGQDDAGTFIGLYRRNPWTPLAVWR